MKLSTRGRYGVRALWELALNHPRGPITLNHIAKKQGISAKYLEQLLIPLKGAGLVSSLRGARGGYKLTKDPGEITLYDIVKVLEGPLVVVDCVDNPASCTRQSECVVRELWDEMTNLLKDFLSSTTLAHLVTKKQSLPSNQDMAEVS
ncbi:MAG: Rrf2 family transcriptional regulator [Desulfarculaceae bacterium]